jgi:hypothetical protein
MGVPGLFPVGCHSNDNRCFFAFRQITIHDPSLSEFPVEQDLAGTMVFPTGPRQVGKTSHKIEKDGTPIVRAQRFLSARV